MRKLSEIMGSQVCSALVLGYMALSAVLFLGTYVLGSASGEVRFVPLAGLAAAGLVSLVLVSFWRDSCRRSSSRRRDYSGLPLSFFDTMTGMPNRLYFQDKIAAMLSSDQGGSIIVLDLADFSKVNDRRGRAFGDVVIKETGRRLRHWAEGAEGIAARLSGDSFGVFLPNTGQADLDRMCGELVKLCDEPVIKGGDVVEPQVSIGAVDSASLGDLREFGYDAVMSVCKFALSSAKTEGSGAYRIYNEALEKEFVDLDAMAVELPDALRNGQLEVFLQPRCQLGDGALIGFESLVRWKRNGEYVPAEDLIRMAEETGLIFELDRYMIDRSIQTLADWNRRRKTRFPVSVNLSALHFRVDKGVEFILDCLRRHRLPPELLTVEVTETANLAVLQQVKGLFGLRDAGCRIAIDDFGTGYASLARLRALPADEIKIDRLLVSELLKSSEARHILEAVLFLAERLEMEVVAEGVEDEAQSELLVEMGCRFGQGFLFGHPRPALDWLADATYGPSGEQPAA